MIEKEANKLLKQKIAIVLHNNHSPGLNIFDLSGQC